MLNAVAAVSAFTMRADASVQAVHVTCTDAEG